MDSKGQGSGHYITRLKYFVQVFYRAIWTLVVIWKCTGFPMVIYKPDRHDQNVDQCLWGESWKEIEFVCITCSNAYMEAFRIM